MNNLEIVNAAIEALEELKKQDNPVIVGYFSSDNGMMNTNGHGELEDVMEIIFHGLHNNLPTEQLEALYLDFKSRQI